MKNPIISSVIIVVGFWYVVALLGLGINVLSIPRLLGEAAVVSALGGLAGVIGFAIYERMDAGARAFSLLGKTVRGVSLTIGDFPVPLRTWPRAGAEDLFGASLQKWLEEYKSRHPVHFACFTAVAETLCAKRNLPAATVKRGHGGVTLPNHSVAVMVEAIALTRTWEFSGQKNKKGQVVVPLKDPAFNFEKCRHNPTIPLAAFAHDLGKIETFQEAEDGVTQQMNVDGIPLPHDDMGARILRSMPEVWQLPRRDRDVLLLAVGYHHHTGSLPTSDWIDDEMRAICELVTAADIAAGRKEGRGEVATEGPVEVLEPPLPVIDEGYFPEAEAEGLATSEPGATVTVIGAASPVPQTATTGPERDDAEMGNDETFDLLVRLLLEAGRINGAQRDKRVGFKHAPWIYISDVHLRKAFSLAYNRPELVTQPTRGQIHPFTHGLLESLKARGFLMDHWQGATFSTKRAMFKTISSGKGGKGLLETPFTIIFAANAIPALAKIPDCPHPPEIVGPAWGEHSASNKTIASAAPADATPDSVPSESADAELSGLPELDIPVSPAAPSATGTSGIPEIDVPIAEETLPETPDSVPIDAVAAELKAMIGFSLPQEQCLPCIERKIDGERTALFERDMLRREYATVDWDGLDTSSQLPQGMKWVEYEGTRYLGVIING